VELGCSFGPLDDTFSLKNLSNFFELRRKVTLRKPDLTQALDIAEFFTSFLKQYDRLGETQSTLKQSDLMNDIHSGLCLAISEFVFCSHDDERTGG